MLSYQYDYINQCLYILKKHKYAFVSEDTYDADIDVIQPKLNKGSLVEIIEKFTLHSRQYVYIKHNNLYYSLFINQIYNEHYQYSIVGKIKLDSRNYFLCGMRNKWKEVIPNYDA